MLDRDELAQTFEEVIEPDLPIVDPHHHLWQVATRYGCYDLDDLRADTGSGHNVTDTVFIDCGAAYETEGPVALRPVGETKFVTFRAIESESTPGAKIAGIVGHADLMLGDAVEEVLNAHLDAARGRFRGIRHSGARAGIPEVSASRVQPPPELYRRSDFLVGAKKLAAMGLSFDAWQYHHQLGDVVYLARAVPELSIIVNHLGGPLGVGIFADQRDQVLVDTRKAMTTLAAEPNVKMKLGGIGMDRFGGAGGALDHHPRSEEIVARWGGIIRYAIDVFGPDRCMFESNFPVDGQTTSYAVLWNAFKKMTVDYTTEERSALFAETARRVYRL